MSTRKVGEMTRETYKHAEYLVHDIEILKTVKDSQDQNHWVAYVTADDPKTELSQFSDELTDDFKEFIAKEIEKLENILESL